ncbi:MAG: hypothetical protein AAB400_05440 [Patescibacteria group bacterium]
MLFKLKNEEKITIVCSILVVTVVLSISTVFAAGEVKGQKLCIGTDCRTSWPTAASNLTSNALTLGTNGRIGYDGTSLYLASKSSGSAQIYLDTQNDQALRLNVPIKSQLRIGTSSDSDQRRDYRIEFGDIPSDSNGWGYVRLGEWDEDDKLSVYAKKGTEFSAKADYINQTIKVKGGAIIEGNLKVAGTIRPTRTQNIIASGYSDDTGGSPWTRVWEAPFNDGKGENKQSNTTYTSLDSNKAVLGFKVQGGAGDGGACVFGVNDYFIGAVRYKGYVNKLRTDGVWSGNSCYTALGGSYRDWGNNKRAVDGGPEIIFENIDGGKENASNTCSGTEDFLYNKAPGLIYIPPGNVLWSTQFYSSDDDNKHESYCRILVLYSNE